MSGSGYPSYTTSYDGQTLAVLNIPGRGDNYIYVGDRPNPGDTTVAHATRLFIPIVFPTSTSMTITWGPGTWFDGTACSHWSLDTTFPTVSGAPLAATGLRVTNCNCSQVALSWTNNETHAANIYLDRATDSAFTANLASEVLTFGATSFTDTTIVSGTSYYYRIRTVNANGTTNSAATQWLY